uniref:Syntaxin 7like protein putative n=1 Tax=Albugo laibachii Nc14 TaxID=890382 RepID=F0WBT4_9STRA|nr:syntaxin 7like protein putative [Albugo laibachii Nc14]CCA20567.1 syntaxin 7like protein putative [Albugo laibachii Nc14]|eukprot:CCA20567.1 syntaxin 7like protein putative [Albugo laibachii Nc14]
MGDRYVSADSPTYSDERYNRLVQESSKGISTFNQVTRSIAQKMSLFGTPQDSRENHNQIKELTDKGNKMSTKLSRRIQELNRACQGGSQERARKTQVNKLASDFKNQLKSFETTCERLITSEQQTIEHIRRSSTSYERVSEDDIKPKFGFGNYNEDQIYAQANVTTYDEDDLARREEDIVHINHQLREVNAAFREIDGLVEDQGETVVEVQDNTETVKENVAGALENVRQADKKTGWFKCSKFKLIGIGILLMLVIIAVISFSASSRK